MDTEQMTKNHVSYMFSKEVILKGLLSDGVISDADFERYNQMLYDRYHISPDLGLPRPIVSKCVGSTPEPEVRDEDTLLREPRYVSLTAIAREVNSGSPGYVVQSWLRDARTIAYLRFWEMKNNPDFDESGFQGLMEELKTPSMTLTAKKWILATSAIGLQSKLGKGGGTLSHPEIAVAFQAWIYPEFQYEMIRKYMAADRG